MYVLSYNQSGKIHNNLRVFNILTTAIILLLCVIPEKILADIPLLPEGKAVIVFRHAQEEGQNTGTMSVTLPNGQQLNYQTKLNDEGKQCSKQLSTLLPEFIMTKKMYPISRVITVHPTQINPKTGQYPTPNPFDTAYPLIKSQNTQDVVLLTNPDDVMSHIDNTNGSVVISYDRESLWGTNEDTSPIPGSIIYNLDQKLGIINPTLQFHPCKCIDIYVYTRDATGTKNQIMMYSLSRDPVVNGNPSFGQIEEGKSAYCY